MSGTGEEREPPLASDAFGALKVEAVARTRRRGVLRRTALFASGVRKELLRFVPTEETWFAVLGTFVVLASALAFVAAAVASSYNYYGDLRVTKVTIGIGVFWALVIFILDRSIVKMPLNQVRFGQDVMEMLAKSDGDIIWYQIAEGSRTQAIRRTPAMFVGVFAAASVRILIALCTSFIFAETLLFVIYDHEVDQRAADIASKQERQIEREFQRKLSEDQTSLQQRIDTLIAGISPDLPADKKALKVLDAKIKGYRSDVIILGQAYDFECTLHTAHTFVLSDGTKVQTSGQAGCGPIKPVRILSIQEDRKQLLAEARGRRPDLAKKVDDGQAAIDDSPAYQDLLKEQQALSQQTAPIDAGTGDATGATTSPAPSDAQQAAVRGLGIREQALRDFEHDLDPATLEVQEAKPCGGDLGGAWCKLHRLVIYPSPVGAKVAAYRWLLFLVELMPVLGKVAFSLRRRRPYDTLVGAMELYQVGASVGMAARELTAVGAEVEMDSATRRELRGAAQAEVILNRDVVAARRRASDQRWRGLGRFGIWRYWKRPDGGLTERDSFPRPGDE